MKKLYIIICVFALFGCSGFLEEYSQDKAYIRSYEDLDELLLGNAYFERYQTSNSWQFSGISGELYYPWIHVMADELCQQTEEIRGLPLVLVEPFMDITLGSTVFMRTWRGNKYGMTGRISDICTPISMLVI